MYRELAEKRRKEIGGKLEDGELMIAFAGNDELGVAQEARWEEMDCNFFYLIGQDVPGGILLLANVKGVQQEFLFIRRGTENEAFYIGMQRDLSYYREMCGISSVLYMENFDDVIESLAMQTKLRTLYFTSAFQKPSKYPRFESLLAEKMRRSYPGIRIDSLSEEVGFMRLKKTTLEVAQIREAIRKTKKALEAAAAFLRPGVMDYQLQSVIEHELKMAGVNPGLVLALLGGDATILHNFNTGKKAEHGELFLADILTRCNYYWCDISRTFPVSGKFTEEQAYWYNVCLRTQQLVIEHLRPGMLRKDCGLEANEYLEGELRKHGYLAENEDVRSLIGQCRINYATPGMVNHGVGLHYGESREDEEGRIVPGMVFTVEPGIYLGEKGLGIRIEDNILITETGYEVLSRDIPKSIDEIEKMVQGQL